MIDRLGRVSPRTALLCNLVLAQAAMACGDRGAARRLAEEAEAARRLDDTATHLNGELDEVLRALRTGDEWLGHDLQLTMAELRVLQYLPTHLSLQEIADELHITRNTAKSHVVAIYRKLGAEARSDAVARAREIGMLTEVPLT